MAEDGGRLFNYFMIGGLSLHSFDLTSERNLKLQNTHIHPSERKYFGDVLWRYPSTDYEDTSLQGPAVLEFCFPERLQLSATYMTPLFHTFAMTDESGTRTYGGCLSFYEALDESLLAAYQALVADYMNVHTQNTPGSKVMYGPKCLVILSAYPFLSLFKDILSELYLISQESMFDPLERYIVNICKEIPVPPPGKVEVKMVLNKVPIYFSRPPVNSYHPTILDYCLEFLFCRLDTQQVVRLVTHALLEHRIVFLSSNYSALHTAAESLLALMYPFYWHHVYIPILPTSMFFLVQAFMPFMCGVHSRHREEIMQLGGDELVYVDLDRRTLQPNTDPSPALPTEIHTKLMEKLSSVVYLPKTDSITRDMLGDTDQAFSIVLKEKEGTNRHPALYYSPLKSVSANAAQANGRSPYIATAGTAPSPLARRRAAHMEARGSIPHPEQDNVHIRVANLTRQMPAISNGADVDIPLENYTFHRFEQRHFTSLKYCSYCSKILRSISSAQACCACKLAFHAKTCEKTAGPCGPRFDTPLVREAFLNVLVTLFAKYRDFMKDDGGFNNDAFLMTVDTENKEFVAALLQTQAFSQFIVERVERDPNDFEVLFFDEHIKKKLNRSVTGKMGNKKPTPFLDDQKTYSLTSTFVAKPPDLHVDGMGRMDVDAFIVDAQSLMGALSFYSPPSSPSPGQLEGACSFNSLRPSTTDRQNVRNLQLRRFPTNMREDLLTARPCEVLLDEAVVVKLKAQTNQLKREARLKNMQKFKAYKMLLQSDDEQQKTKREQQMVTRLVEIHQKIENAALTGARLQNAPIEEVEWAIKCLLQHQQLVRETSDLCGDGSDESARELQVLLKTLINHLMKHEDRLAQLKKGQGQGEVAAAPESPSINRASSLQAQKTQVLETGSDRPASITTASPSQSEPTAPATTASPLISARPKKAPPIQVVPYAEFQKKRTDSAFTFMSPLGTPLPSEHSSLSGSRNSLAGEPSTLSSHLTPDPTQSGPLSPTALRPTLSEGQLDSPQPPRPAQPPPPGTTFMRARTESSASADCPPPRPRQHPDHAVDVSRRMGHVYPSGVDQDQTPPPRPTAQPTRTPSNLSEKPPPVPQRTYADRRGSYSDKNPPPKPPPPSYTPSNSMR